jgi:hypothetical protein
MNTMTMAAALGITAGVCLAMYQDAHRARNKKQQGEEYGFYVPSSNFVHADNLGHTVKSVEQTTGKFGLPKYLIIYNDGSRSESYMHPSLVSEEMYQSKEKLAPTKSKNRQSGLPCSCKH